MSDTERATESAAEGAIEGAIDSESGALLERLAVIEQQPLESRADSFQQLHDVLQRELDGGSAE